MITIQQDKLNQNIKRVTAASVEDYANAIRSVANIIGTVIAFILAVVATAKAAYQHPIAALDQWTKPAPEAVATPVKAPPTKKTSKPRPVKTVSVITETPEASTPNKKRAPRPRKKQTLVTA